MLKFGKSILAGAVTLAMSAPALALPPGTATQVTLDVSGASAADAYFGELAIQLCRDVDGTPGPDDLTIFLDDTNANGIDDGTGIDGASNQAYSCTLDSSKVPGIGLTNPTALIRKSSVGGSGQGVGPVCTGTGSNRPFLNVTAANCSDAGGPANRFICGTTFVQSIPHGGVSDVAPNETGGGTASAGCDNVKSTFGTGFGVVATTRLRNALQAAQGLTVGSDLAADMPSISTAHLASMSTGRLQNWRQFKVGGVDLVTAATNAGLAAPSSDLITLCRRVESSGTTAAFKLRVLESPSGLNFCSNGAQLLRFPGNDSTGPLVLPENSSNTNLGACVGNQDVDNPPDYRPDPSDPTFLLPTSNWAIGVHNSTEENANLAVSYRFLRLDGVLPTIDNIANGTYSWWTESTLQWRSAGVTAAQAAIMNAFVVAGATPSAVATANIPALHPWGQGGKVSLASGGCAVDPDGDDLWETTHPCSPYANTFAGNTNNCTGPYLRSGIETVLGPNEDVQLDGDTNNPPL
jgi:hypothetical protein